MKSRASRVLLLLPVVVVLLSQTASAETGCGTACEVVQQLICDIWCLFGACGC